MGDPYAKHCLLQPDQVNRAVLFWFIVESDASVRYCTVAYTGRV